MPLFACYVVSIKSGDGNQIGRGISPDIRCPIFVPLDVFQSNESARKLVRAL